MTEYMSHRPLISVVIPTFMRRHKLGVCLEALASQIFPRDRFEVLVVDDGSAESPADVVASFQKQLNVVLVIADHGGPAAARNVGAQRARGEILAFTDDDCMPDANWISTLAAHFATHPDAGFGGQVVNALPGNKYSDASQLLVSYLYDYYAGQGQGFFCSNNIAFSANGFRELGGFAVGVVGLTGEDRELCERWLHSGRTIAYVHDAIVYHAHDLSAPTFLRQHWRYGRDAIYVHRLRRERTGSGAEIRLSFYWRMLRYPFDSGRGRRAPVLMGLLAMSQAAYCAGILSRFVSERFRLAGPERKRVQVETRYD